MNHGRDIGTQVDGSQRRGRKRGELDQGWACDPSRSPEQVLADYKWLRLCFEVMSGTPTILRATVALTVGIVMYV